MAKITKTMVGESLVGDGNEVAHIDLIIGPRGAPVETRVHACPDQQEGRLHLAAGGDCAQLAVQAAHLDVQQGDDQGRQAGRADVRSGAGARWPERSPIAWPKAPSRRTKPTICSSASACSSTGMRRRSEDLRLQLQGHQRIAGTRHQRRPATCRGHLQTQFREAPLLAQVTAGVAARPSRLCSV